MGSDPGPTVTGYCHDCGDEVRIYRTVPWQENFCSTCGSSDVEVEP